MTERYDHRAESGETSPHRLTLTENGIETLIATGETAEAAITAACWLLIRARERTGRGMEPLGQALREAADALEDGLAHR